MQSIDLDERQRGMLIAGVDECEVDDGLRKKKENGSDGASKARERREKCALGIFHRANKKEERWGLGLESPGLRARRRNLGAFWGL